MPHNQSETAKKRFKAYAKENNTVLIIFELLIYSLPFVAFISEFNFTIKDTVSQVKQDI